MSTFSSLYSQVIDSKQYNYTGNWYNWQGGRFITNLNLPKVTATTGRDTGGVRYSLADSSVYVWTGYQWRQIGGGGSGSADSSVYATRYYTQQTFVPYTGATGSVNLGLWGLTTDRFVFNQTPTLAGGERIMRWNDTDGTLDLGVKGGNVTLQVGQEQHSRVRNNTGSTITNGQVVYISGSTGTNTTVALARADAYSTSQTTIGIATEDIPNGQSGFVTTFGKVRDIPTTGLTEGSPVYLSSTAYGGLTSTAPTGDTYPIVVGICERTHAVNGVIFVHVDREFIRKYEVDTAKANIRATITNPDTLYVATTDTLFVDSTYFFGQSLTLGNTLGTGYETLRWPYLMSQQIRTQEVNKAVGSTAIQTNSVRDYVIANTPLKTDKHRYILYMYGTIEVGSLSEDTTLYKTNFQMALDTAFARGFVADELKLLTMPSYPIGNQTKIANYIRATRTLAENNGIQLIDMFSLTKVADTAWLQADLLHQNIGSQSAMASFVAQHLGLPTPVKTGNNFTVTGNAEMEMLRLTKIDTSVVSDDLAGFKANGEIVRVPKTNFVPSNYGTTPGTGAINIAGRGYFGGVTAPTAEYLQSNYGIRSNYLRINGAAPVGNLGGGASLEFQYTGGQGVIYAFDRSTSTTKPLVFSSNSSYVSVVPPQINSQALVIKGSSLPSPNTGNGVEITAGGSNTINSYNRTSGAFTQFSITGNPLILGVGVGQVIVGSGAAVGSHTMNVTGTALFQSSIYQPTNVGVVATANYTIVAADTYIELPDLAAQANRTLTLPAASSHTGRTLIIKNKDSDATFNWAFSTAVKDKTDADVTTLIDDTVYHIRSNGTSWVITMIY